jgi:hypothetical protein
VALLNCCCATTTFRSPGRCRHFYVARVSGQWFEAVEAHLFAIDPVSPCLGRLGRHRRSALLADHYGSCQIWTGMQHGDY